MTATTISDPLRPAVLAHDRKDGGVVISRGMRFIALNEDEAARLADYISGRGRIMRHPVS